MTSAGILVSPQLCSGYDHRWFKFNNIVNTNTNHTLIERLKCQYNAYIIISCRDENDDDDEHGYAYGFPSLIWNHIHKFVCDEDIKCRLETGQATRFLIKYIAHELAQFELYPECRTQTVLMHELKKRSVPKSIIRQFWPLITYFHHEICKYMSGLDICQFSVWFDQFANAKINDQNIQFVLLNLVFKILNNDFKNKNASKSKELVKQFNRYCDKFAITDAILIEEIQQIVIDETKPFSNCVILDMFDNCSADIISDVEKAFILYDFLIPILTTIALEHAHENALQLQYFYKRVRLKHYFNERTARDLFNLYETRAVFRDDNELLLRFYESECKYNNQSKPHSNQNSNNRTKYNTVHHAKYQKMKAKHYRNHKKKYGYHRW